jgi:hypothetical protein
MAIERGNGILSNAQLAMDTLDEGFQLADFDADASGGTVVISWNVLTKAFVSPKAYPQMSKKSVNNDLRWKLVKAQLQKFLAYGAVVLLQEVDQEWASRILTLAHKAGYYAHQTRYGSPWSNYMALLMLLPLGNPSRGASMRLISGPAETRIGDEIRKARRGTAHGGEPSWAYGFLKRNVPRTGWLRSYMFGSDVALEGATTAWNFAQSATLAVGTPDGERTFTVANYHVPCWLTPTVGGFNVGRAVRESHLAALIRWASRGNTPAVIGTDTNMSPDETQSVVGALPRILRANSAGVQPSVHMAATTSTISARSPQGFVGALDQIFVSPCLAPRRTTAKEKDALGFSELHARLEYDPNVEGAPVKRPENLDEYWPNETHPSDHLPVATVVRCNFPRDGTPLAAPAEKSDETCSVTE